MQLHKLGKLYAGRGEILTCSAGHECYEVVEPLLYGQVLRVAQLKPLNGMPTPLRGDHFPKCHCGADIAVRMRFHFDGKLRD